MCVPETNNNLKLRHIWRTLNSSFRKVLRSTAQEAYIRSQHLAKILYIFQKLIYIECQWFPAALLVLNVEQIQDLLPY